MSYPCVCLSFRLSVWNNSVFTGWILMKFWHVSFFRKSVDKIWPSLKFDKTKGTVHENFFTFMTISRCILHRTTSVSDKSCRENQNTHLMLSISPPPENPAIYEIGLMSKNTLQPKDADDSGGAFHAGLVRLHARDHESTPLRARLHAGTHTHRNI